MKAAAKVRKQAAKQARIPPKQELHGRSNFQTLKWASSLVRPGQLVQAQKGNIVFTKWHDKINIAFLATNVSPGEASCTVQRKEKSKEIEIVKPRVSDVYTVNMGGVDRADLLRLY